MPGKKKGGKKKRKSHKKKDENEMTPEEAILAYQISIKERRLEEIKIDLKQLEEEKQKNIDRNEALRKEEAKYAESFAKPALTFAGKSTISVRYDDLVEHRKEKWAAEKREIQDLHDLQNEIERTIKETEDSTKEIARLSRYRDVTKPLQEKQMRLLEQEMEDLKTTYDDIMKTMARSNERMLSELVKTTAEEVTRRKDAAEQESTKILDKYTLWEMGDNEWLKSEVKLHTERVESLRNEVTRLEQENLATLARLFQCTIEDLRLCKQFYLTQFEDRENLELTARLQYNLEKLGLIDPPDQQKTFSRGPEDDDFGLRPSRPTSTASRPKSAVQLMVDAKLAQFGYTAPPNNSDVPIERLRLPPSLPPLDPELTRFWHLDTDLIGPEGIESLSLGQKPPSDSTYITPAPGEFKLLSIIGQRMRLSTPAPYEEPADLSGSSSGVGVSPGLLSPDRFEGWGRAIKRSLTRSGFSYPQPPLPSPAKSTHDGAQAATATQ